jgi:hypothetical protein
MREAHQMSLKLDERRIGGPRLDPPPDVRIVRLLDAFEAGELNAWWRLNMDLTLEPNSTHYGNELEADLTELPGWQAADLTTRDRILRAAHRYLLDYRSDTETRIGTNEFDRRDLAGYRALRVLAQEAPEILVSLPQQVWKHWASIVVAYPTGSDTRERHWQKYLVTAAYRRSPSAVTGTLTRLIEKENSGSSGIYVTNLIVDCWDEALAQAILDIVRGGNLKPEALATLLSDLLDHQVEGAQQYAESLLSSALHSMVHDRSMALAAAQSLLMHAPDAGWSVLWQVLQAEVEFGQQVIIAVSDNSRPLELSVFQRLTEMQLAELYLWLVDQFPPEEDPNIKGPHWVGSRESVASWRDDIITHLRERGTPEAVEALERLRDKLPRLDWLKGALLAARETARRKIWVPPTPEMILKLADDSEARLVRDGDELLDVLLESLQRLNEKLQGETPAAQFLWHPPGAKTKQPVDENTLSDFVKYHFDEDLQRRAIIANREVVIRSGTGSGSGERTDIHIDAISRSPHHRIYDVITAIIEVKGCWHPELNHAMETQLVGRYLKDNQCRHGLYVIGWFNCPQWDPKDSRCQRASKRKLKEAREQLERQAIELSSKLSITVRSYILNTSLRHDNG